MKSPRTLLPIAVLASALSASTAVAEHPALPCAYSPLLGEMQSHQNCAWRDQAGTLHIRPGHLQKLDFDEDGLASIDVDGWYYVRHDGRLAPAMTFDNGADYFFDDRARSPRNGKIGYIDRHLNLVIPARYDGALPFDHGVAAVCDGCMVKHDGENGWYQGGKWACIDPSGREQSSFRALKPGENGDAVCLKFRA